ncbi:hypothetical protein JGU71_08015 [Antrihabitans sp. YC3-6]|uniref:Uncharacterized protein n=1 Tax=Antrihabitans stalagmiti TaxID=2799499 RepID=A0A934NP64_9NOCA|nr:hypothetical protein [Antrihabitans stalagmiti]MBJ8338829.1 hypothetical protein [Antrihabitans stalagmiti]
MNRMVRDYAADVLLMVLAGFTAAIAMSAPSPTEAIFADFPQPTSVTLFAVTTTVVAVFVRKPALSSGLLGLGLALIGVVALADPWDFDPFVTALGAGLLLGAAAGLTNGSERRLRQQGLAAGVVAGLLLTAPIEHFRSSAPQRYVEYSPDAVDPADIFLLCLVALTSAALLASLQRHRAEPSSPVGDRARELTIGIAIAVAGLLLYESFSSAVMGLNDESFGSHRWVWGLAVVPLLVLFGLWLPGHRGMVLIAILAFIAANSSGALREADSILKLSLVAALVVAGVVVGRRWPRPLAGVCALAVVAATSVLNQPPWDNVNVVAVLVILPFAAAFTVASCLPSSAAVTGTALAAPITLSVSLGAVGIAPLVAEFGWTAYAPLTSGKPVWFTDTWQWISMGVSVGTIALCGLALAALMRRPSEQPAEPCR